MSSGRRGERGSAVVEAVMAIFVLMVIVLGTIEVAFALYARNVVAAAAHEGARAAVERGRTTTEAESIAREAVVRSAGGLVRDLRVSVDTRAATVRVTVSGVLKPFGPVPVPLALSTTASVSREVGVR